MTHFDLYFFFQKLKQIVFRSRARLANGDQYSRRCFCWHVPHSSRTHSASRSRSSKRSSEVFVLFLLLFLLLFEPPNSVSLFFLRFSCAQCSFVVFSAAMDAMVADFGLSAKTAEGKAQETYFKGALKYMAPESLVGNCFFCSVIVNLICTYIHL